MHITSSRVYTNLCLDGIFKETAIWLSQCRYSSCSDPVIHFSTATYHILLICTLLGLVLTWLFHTQQSRLNTQYARLSAPEKATCDQRLCTCADVGKRCVSTPHPGCLTLSSLTMPGVACTVTFHLQGKGGVCCHSWNTYTGLSHHQPALQNTIQPRFLKESLKICLLCNCGTKL